MSELKWYKISDSEALFPQDYLQVSDSHKNIKPQWWSNLTAYVFKTNSVSQFLDKVGISKVIKIGKPFMFRTIKSCPGMLDYFKRCLPLKATADIFIETFEDGTHKAISYDRSLKIDFHSSKQLEGHLSKDFIALKFSFDILFSVDDIVSFGDPILYNHVPWIVSPGVISKEQMPNSLSVIVYLPKIDKEYYINAGTVLACMQTSNVITHIYEEKKLKKQYHRKQYILERSAFKGVAGMKKKAVDKD